jgi:hypothetical protein
MLWPPLQLDQGSYCPNLRGSWIVPQAISDMVVNRKIRTLPPQVKTQPSKSTTICFTHRIRIRIRITIILVCFYSVHETKRGFNVTITVLSNKFLPSTYYRMYSLEWNPLTECTPTIHFVKYSLSHVKAGFGNDLLQL